MYDVFIFLSMPDHRNDPKANFCCVCGLEFHAKEELFAEKLKQLDGADSPAGSVAESPASSRRKGKSRSGGSRRAK